MMELEGICSIRCLLSPFGSSSGLLSVRHCSGQSFSKNPTCFRWEHLIIAKMIIA